MELENLKIELAGYNVEAEILEQFDRTHKDILTPEIFSAAYARISRSAKDISALRKQAREDVKQARESNRAIIFEMGHHSVAEHAVFNFDITGVSRLALEEIESFRLASYTEKSQRYVTLKGDYLIPEEITGAAERDQFRALVEEQNAFYKKAFGILQDYQLANCPGLDDSKDGRRLLQNLAKEDARYILALATQGQVGATFNARTLEHLFRRFALSKRAEVRQIGQRMYELVMKIAPSIFLFAQPSQFEKDLQDSFKKLPSWPSSLSAAASSESSTNSAEIKTKLIHYTKNGDDMILASFLALIQTRDYGQALEIVKRMEPGDKEKIFKQLFQHMEFFDTPPRDFELPDITFQAVISASNFAQLKRHRIATLIPGPYETALGNTIPESIRVNGLEDEFTALIEKTNRLYLQLKEKYHEGADYILTNSHRRMVIMKMNLREVYHFMRLRDDAHAQWDIRNLAGEILQQLKEVMPYSTLLLCGKSRFVEEFGKLYGSKPRIEI